MTPVRIRVPSKLDLDIDPGRKVELHQRVDGLRSGIDDVEKPLVSPDLELFAALFVHMRRAVDGEAFEVGRQRDWTPHLRARPLCRVHDLPRRIVENAVVEGLEPYADVLTLDV